MSLEFVVNEIEEDQQKESPFDESLKQEIEERKE